MEERRSCRGAWCSPATPVLALYAVELHDPGPAPVFLTRLWGRGGAPGPSKAPRWSLRQGLHAMGPDGTWKYRAGAESPSQGDMWGASSRFFGFPREILPASPRLYGEAKPTLDPCIPVAGVWGCCRGRRGRARRPRARGRPAARSEQPGGDAGGFVLVFNSCFGPNQFSSVLRGWARDAPPAPAGILRPRLQAAGARCPFLRRPGTAARLAAAAGGRGARRRCRETGRGGGGGRGCRERWVRSRRRRY